MSDFRSPLESAEAFAAYRDRIKHQLKVQVTERIGFLESAFEELNALASLARKASNVPLVSELVNFAQQAERESGALKGFTIPATLQSDGTTAAAIVQSPRRSEALDDQDHSAVDSFGRSKNYLQSRPTPVVPKTAYRPTDEIFKDVDRLNELAEQARNTDCGVPGLVRLKAFLCRQRGLQAELAAQDIQHWPLRQLMGYLRRRIDEEHGPNHYLVPLRQEIWPTEAWPWMQLGLLYDGLADAYDSLAFYDSHLDSLNKNERQELLESLAAHQTRLYRHLQTYFPRQNDEHQIQLFRELCAIADEEDIYLYCLQERYPDDGLNERAEALPSIMENLRLDRDQRARRTETIDNLTHLVLEDGFGTSDEDSEALIQAVVICRQAGVPASNTQLREKVWEWVSLLEKSDDKCVQEVVREVQRESERQAARAEQDSLESDRSPLTESEQSELDAVRAVVAGKKMLFIGGVCREESRAKIEKELELEELLWPDTTGTESVYKFEHDIENTDFTVVLVRFMRTGWGQARELALRHDKQFLRLPAGYGLRQVVRQFYLQLVNSREPVASGR